MKNTEISRWTAMNMTCAPYFGGWILAGKYA